MARVVDEGELPPLDPLVVKVQPAEVLRGPPDAYKNVSQPRGTVFIANYRRFDEEKHETRVGSEYDVQKQRDLFKQMGYKIIRDLDSASNEDTLDALKRFRDDEIHKKVDSLIVIFMSHGCGKEAFCTSDGKPLSCEEVYSIFSNTNCPALSGKPKLFVFQFCRGDEEHISVYDGKKESASIDDPLTRTTPKTTKRKERKLSDVFICFSTLSGFVSYRHEDSGSPYIDKVCRVFMDHAKDKDFDGLMKKVSRELPEAVAGEVRHLTVKHDFFFNPPSNQGEQDEGEVCQKEFPPTYGTDDTYKNSSNSRGLVLIFNNLPGCAEDVTKLSYLFSKLGYEVFQPFLNLTHARLIEEFENFKQREQGDSAIVIFYGEGFEDCLVSTDGKILTFQELTERFNDIRCPNLAGKPKIFILNTCYYTGTIPDKEQCLNPNVAGSRCSGVSPECQGWYTDGGVEDTGRTLELEIPAERDMILFSVEVDGGRCDSGSLLTDALCQTLMSSEVSVEISPLLRRVCRRLDDWQGRGREEYFPEVRSIKFRRDFYFNPPQLITPDTPSDFCAMPRELHRSSYPSKEIIVKDVIKPRACQDHYTNWSEPHGLATIVWYDKYEREGLPNCLWRQDDAYMLSDLMEKLGYETELHSNISLGKMKDILQKFRDRKKLYEVDSMIFVVLGLASDENTLYSPSGASLPVNSIYEYFTDAACPALKGKPKVFFFHMTQLHRRWASPASPLAEVPHDAFVLRLVSKASPEKGLHPSQGLWALREALERHSHETHLEDIVRKAQAVLDSESEWFSYQCWGFKKKFYFNPRRVRQ